MAEAGVPGLSVAGIGLIREGCEPQWFIAGFIEGALDQPSEVVYGTVNDRTGEFEMEERYTWPALP